MTQRTHGIHSVLSFSIAYNLFQWLAGRRRAQSQLLDDYVKPQSGFRILDLGCGTGNILDALPDVDYVGCDLNSHYIAAARKKYGKRGTFHVCDVRHLETDEQQPFDIALAVGLLHHLDDDVASTLFATVRRVLAPGGRLVTIDPTFVDDQHPFARFLIKMDRGIKVRREAEMLRLANQHFNHIASHVRHDMLRIPYSHLILEAFS